MANKYRGEVGIRLDRVRILKYTFNSLAEFEELTGKSVNEIFSGSEKSMGFTMIRNLIWAGLIHEDESLTPSRVGILIEQADGESITDKVAYVTEKMAEAINESFVTSGDKDAKKKAVKEPE